MQLVFEAIGTHWIVDLKTDQKEVGFWQRLVMARINVFEKIYSRFLDTSVVMEISKKAGTYVLGEDSKRLFGLYKRLYRLSGGAFSPLMADTLISAGYDKTYQLRPQKQIVAPPPWDEVMTFADGVLKTKVPVGLDFGAAGKGYLVDLLKELLVEAGVEAFTIDAGGDIWHQGKTSLSVGLENPEDKTEVIGVTEISHQSICGSSGNRRTWGAWHHIINPLTLLSPIKVKAVWVVAPTALEADGLATCLFLVDPEKLTADFAFEYLILFDDFSIKKSEGFRGQIFYSKIPSRLAS